MKRNELTPNVVTYNTIIKALVNRPYTYASTDASSANSTHRNTASQSNQSGTEYTSKDGGIHTTNTGDVSTVTSSTATGVSAYRLSIIDHVYHTMSEEGVEPNSKTFNTMKRAFQQDPVRLARLQAERDQSFRIPPDAASFNIELHTLSKKEKFEDLLTVFDRMRREGVTPTVVTYNTMLNAFSRKGNVKKDRVLYLWTLMRTDGVTPDAFSYNAMLAMHNFTDDFDAAWGLYREMRGQGVQPDIVTYKVAIDACGWHRQIDKVSLFFSTKTCRLG